MRHAKKNRKFGRESKQREAFMRSLAINLIERNRIRTTRERAKELRPFVEKLITKSKIKSVATMRYLTAHVSEGAKKLLLNEIGPRYAARAGGYTRLRLLAPRISDGARMAIIELI